MAKLKNPLSSLGAIGRIANALTIRRHKGQQIAEAIPLPTDTKSPGQLTWRHMFLKAVALWHALSADEKNDWESLARRRHMTGYAYFLSQALRPNPGIYLPLQGGTMQGDIDMAKHRLLKLPLPTDNQEAASKVYVDAYASFLGLTDTPAAYAGQALKGVRVNAAQNALEFAALVGGYTEGCRAYHNIDQAIPTGVWTDLAFNLERYDTDNIHSTTVNNHRFYAKTAGYYIGVVQANFAFHATGNRHLRLEHSAYGTIFFNSWHALLATDTRMFLVTINHMAVDQYVWVRVNQTSGGNLNIRSLANYTPEFMIQKIG